MRKALLIFLFCVTASPIWAADFAGAWVKQLQLDGYEEITISKTWLGRIRIIAEKDEIEREIILIPRTGEVLRDFSRHEDGSSHLPLGFEVELEDDDDDEDDEDEEEDD